MTSALVADPLEAASARVLELGLLTEAQVDRLTDAIAAGNRTETSVVAELNALKPVSELPAAQEAAATAEQLRTRNALTDPGSPANLLRMLEMTMRATGMQPSAGGLDLSAGLSPVSPSHEYQTGRGCAESEWEGLPAGPIFRAIKQRKTAELDRLLSEDAHAAGQ